MPGPSEPGPSNEDANEDTLLKSAGQTYGRPIASAAKRPRHDGRSASALEKKIKISESSVQKLKVHAEKKTCPKDLRYKVRVNIAPDQDFKSDISRI